MPWWAILLAGYFSTSCAAVCWGVMIDQAALSFKEHDEKELPNSKWTWTGIYIMIFFLWPIMIKDMIDETKELMIASSPTPRCLGCGSDHVAPEEPRERRLISDVARKRLAERRRHFRDRDIYHGYDDEPERDYEGYLERFRSNRHNWGTCNDCGKVLKMEVMKKVKGWVN